MVKKRFKDNKPAKSAEEVLKEKLDGAEKEIGKLSHSKKKKLDKKLRFLEKLHKTEKEIGAAKKPLVRKKKKKGATLNSMDALAEALPTLNLVAKKTGGPTPVAPRATKVATNSQRSRVLYVNAAMPTHVHHCWYSCLGINPAHRLLDDCELAYNAGNSARSCICPPVGLAIRTVPATSKHDRDIGNHPRQPPLPAAMTALLLQEEGDGAPIGGAGPPDIQGRSTGCRNAPPVQHAAAATREEAAVEVRQGVCCSPCGRKRQSHGPPSGGSNLRMPALFDAAMTCIAKAGWALARLGGLMGARGRLPMLELAVNVRNSPVLFYGGQGHPTVIGGHLHGVKTCCTLTVVPPPFGRGHGWCSWIHLAARIGNRTSSSGDSPLKPVDARMQGLSAEDKELSLVPDDHLLDPLVYRRVPRLNILAGALARRSNYSNCDNMMVQEEAPAFLSLGMSDIESRPARSKHNILQTICTLTPCVPAVQLQLQLSTNTRMILSTLRTCAAVRSMRYVISTVNKCFVNMLQAIPYMALANNIKFDLYVNFEMQSRIWTS
eukprot:jgi/Mesvir1/18351/Mv14248-RA.1